MQQPWPWYVTGPLIGLCVPLLWYLTGKTLGISSNLRHICAIILPNSRNSFLRYNWKAEAWNLFFAAGLILGGFIAQYFLSNDRSVLIPESYTSVHGLLKLTLGGFLVGFGTRWANGCTSGHSIVGISNLQWGSLVATCAFFAGGLFMNTVDRFIGRIF